MKGLNAVITALAILKTFIFFMPAGNIEGDAWGDSFICEYIWA